MQDPSSDVPARERLLEISVQRLTLEVLVLELQQRSITQSMSRRGNFLDNPTMESFFGTLKSELFHLAKFTSLEELKIGLEEYIRYYNVDRFKRRLNYLNPVAFRLQSMKN